MSCLENAMDGRAWQATVHGVTKSQTRLSDFTSLLLRLHACVHSQSLQSCPTLCNPMDCRLPGSSVHWILQESIPEWVVMPSFRGSSWPRDGTCISCLAGGFFTTKAPGKTCCCCSVTKSCPTVCNPMDWSMPGLPVHHQLLESTQTHVHWVGDAIQPSHPLSSPSPPALNLSQH